MKKNPAVELKMLVPHPKKVAFWKGKGKPGLFQGNPKVGEILFQLAR